MEKSWNADTELLLVVAYWGADLDWVTCQDDFPYVIGRKFSDDPLCGVPVNKGAEGSTYLKFIINNWQDLPKRVCFLDDHEQSWHQRFDMVEKLRGIRDGAGLPDGYLPLNGLRIDSTEEFRNWKYETFSSVWDAIIKPHLRSDAPTRVITDGSAQFIVSRESILANPIGLYHDLYDYSIGEKRWEGAEQWENDLNWVGGNYFLEWIWELVFTAYKL